MNGWTYVCLAVGLLFLAAPASALIPDDITLDTNKPWLTAGSGDAATVTILVTNGTPAAPVSDVAVDLSVDGTYGSISSTHVTTDSNGKAMATFRHGTVAGTATITATVSEGVDVPLTGSVEQQIDHVAPHKVANLWYEKEVTAGGTTEIVVRMVDEYGNPVDSRRENAEGTDPEAVFFVVGSPAGFVNGTDEITVPVDAAGNVTATLRVDTMAGENLVSIYPPAPIVSDMISITGEGGLPAAITQEVTPSSGSVPADGKTKVSFTYTLLDEYGNPSGEQGLWVNATLKRLSQPDEYESRLLNTNSYGQVMITYGPEDSVGMAIITVTAAVNESVSISEDVEFTSTDPTNMLLSASPQSMPSRDVKPDSVSQIRAKVMDVRGNPVEGETVTFEIVSVVTGNYTPTAPPEPDTASAITNDNGYALVEFSPGSFAREGEPGWSETATGTAIVRATWGNVSRDIELTWKNYPYLSVETEVSPETVAVNDTVDVTIRLKGDGWALQPDPIDVVLVIDRSGSMTGADVSPTRMAAAKAAANDFVDQMDAGRDRVALVSFAFDATLDQGLTDDPDEIKGAINSLSADGATNMRMAYYTAIKYLKENGRPDAVKAVILMGDGDWNYHGSPLAKGTGYADNNRYLTSDWYSYPYWAPLSGYRWSGSSYSFSNERYEWYHDLPDPKGDASGTQKLDTGYWYDTWNYNKKEYRTPTNNICDNGQFTNQNMSVYANSGDETGNVTIYSIGFASVLGSDVERDLGVLSEATGGKYVWAGNEAELRNVYTEIAGELKTEAGVDTKLKVVFDNVEVNENLTSGADVFDYVYEDGVSTTIESWVDNETGHYEVINFTTIDQTTDWDDDQNLHFNIGTVRLGQTWETTFRLAVKMEGNINIFGPGSTISFNNGTDSLELPDTFITAVPLNNTGMDFAALEIKDLVFTGTGPIDEFFPVAWDLNYTGLYDVTEDVFYSNDNEYTWVKFDTLSATNTTTGGTSTLDVRGLPPGEYIIWVRGSAPDTADSSDKITMDVRAGATGDAYIRIQ